MKEHPILFSGAMVRAILVGRKTMTRRVMKPQPKGAPDNVRAIEVIAAEMLAGDCCPYGQPGDRLWVRETWRPAYDANLFCCVEYRADGTRRKPALGALTEDQGHRFADDCPDDPDLNVKWRPSIFMPRWACRLVLEVTAVRVERLQDITEEDADAEGLRCGMANPVSPFEYDWRGHWISLWDSINAKRGFGWDVRPWVWVVSFRRLKP